MALASWLLLAMPVAMAVQEPEGTATPAPYASGDAWLDGRLADIDVYRSMRREGLDTADAAAEVAALLNHRLDAMASASHRTTEE